MITQLSISCKLRVVIFRYLLTPPPKIQTDNKLIGHLDLVEMDENENEHWNENKIGKDHQN